MYLINFLFFFQKVAYSTTFPAKYAAITARANTTAYSPATVVPDSSNAPSDETVITSANPSPVAIAWWTKHIATNAERVDCKSASMWA